ncbi:MAG: hypothetical protein JWP34_4624, partial [Massilia sp.]|nr:hypothetical protein [Massilia sp.]
MGADEKVLSSSTGDRQTSIRTRPLFLESTEKGESPSLLTEPEGG